MLAPRKSQVNDSASHSIAEEALSTGSVTTARHHVEKGNEKQVRFGANRSVATMDVPDTQEQLDDGQQPQHRYVSPSRSMTSNCSGGTKNPLQSGVSRDEEEEDHGIPTAVLEYKTYRSPDRASDALVTNGTDTSMSKLGHGEDVPSLCSSRSNSDSASPTLGTSSALNQSKFTSISKADKVSEKCKPDTNDRATGGRSEDDDVSVVTRKIFIEL